MASESGYSNQKKLGRSQFKTIQGVGSDKFGENTAQMYLFDISPSAIAITAVTVDENPQIVWLEIPSHGAKVGDVIRWVDNFDALWGWEVDVIEILDNDTLAIHNITHLNGSDVLPVVGDFVKVTRWTTAKADSEGALQVSQGPLQFTRNGSTQTVIEDTVTPSNNRPLPTGLYIFKDGAFVPVTKDTGIPSNSVGIPVELVAASGTPINITAGDINVQLSDQGVNFDSLRIGDGSGIYVVVNADGSMKVADADVLAELQDILTQITQLNGVDFATEGTLSTISTQLDSLIGKDYATETTLASISAKTPALVGGRVPVDGSGVTQPVSVVALPLPAGAATSEKQDSQITELQDIESDVEAMSAKLPSTLGQKAMAASMSVVVASDQTALSVTQTAQVGSYAEITNLTTSAQTFTAPAGAKWAKVQADDTNTANVRVKIGAAATVSSGMQFQPGRSEDYVGVGNISVIAESGTNQKIYVQWGV
jgi:hypothetical protein